MLSHLRGHIESKHAPWVVIDVQGVGYELQVPMSTFFNLPELQQPCKLLTHLVIREDAHLLYGFQTESERFLFRQLIKVNGIGARIALAVLSSISIEDCMLAIENQEPDRLTKVPGIGKKTAERMLLELKGSKLINDQMRTFILPGQCDPKKDNHSEIMLALNALGYSDKESRKACQNLTEHASVTEGIKQALQQLLHA